MIIEQDPKKYTANDKRTFSREEVESRLDRQGIPIGKETILEKARRFLSEEERPLTAGENIWVIESEEGLGATSLLEELKRLGQEKGMISFHWNLHHGDFPSEENFVWLVDDLTKAGEEDFKARVFDFAAKLKEMIHRQELNKGWILLAGLHKFPHLPEDLQLILRGRSKRLQLLPWKAPEIEGYLRDIFQTLEIPPFLLQVLEKEGRGNPKKISQLLKYYLEKRLLFNRTGQWRKELFHPDPLFATEFGEAVSPSEWDVLFNRLGPDEKKLLFLLANFYEPAPHGFIERWSPSSYLSQHLHRLKSLGAVGGGEGGPYYIARSGFKGFLSERLGREETQKLHDQLLEVSSGEEYKKFFSEEALHFHRARGSDPQSSAEAWGFFGNLAARRGFSQSAYEYYTKAHDQTSPQNLEKRFEYALERGKCLVASNRFPEAKAFFESLLVSYAPQRDKKPNFFSKIYERLGLMEMKRSHLKEARQFFEAALNLLKPGHEPLEQYLGVRNFLASLDLLEGHYEKAIEEFRRNHEKALKDLPWERRRILTNNDLAEALLRKGQVKEAIAHWEACVEDFKKREDRNPLVRCYYQLSLAHQQLKEEENAFYYLSQALEASQGLQNLEMELRIYNALANLKKGKKPAEALECYEKALECTFHSQDPYSTAVILLNMGFLEAELGHWEKVKHCLSQGLAYLEGAQGQEAQTLSLRHAGSQGLARALVSLSEPQEALVHAKKAVVLVDKHPEISEEKFETLFLFRKILKLLGKTSEAERCLRLLEKIAKTPEEQERLKEVV